LQRGSMFVFSIQQFRALIDFDSRFNAIRLDNLLDLGSGDGAVTSKMASFFNNVYVTEMSTTMQWRLGQKGFKVLGIEEWDQYKPTGHNEILKYDAISVLNLLDRCDKPLTLLKQIKMALKPNGLLIIALVLPFKPYVEYNNDNKPLEDLFNDNNNLTQCDVANFCEFKVKTTQFKSKSDKIIHQINLLIEKVTSLDFDLLKFTKLPYLCEGNLSQSYYFMYDYVFIFKAKNQIIK
jgi:SAM-dependent methyltransferase